MAIITIEGLPGAGKTTLRDKLSEKGYNTIQELGGIVHIDKMPGDGKDLQGVLKIDDWFIEQESKRCCMCESNEAVMDRNFFTHLTYSYGYSRLTGIPCFEKTIEKYDLAISKGKLQLPDALVYLDVLPQISKQRQINVKKRLPEFWRNIGFLGDLRSAYFSLMNSLYGLDIHILNGEESIDENLNRLENIIKNSATYGNKRVDLTKFVAILS